MLIDILIIFTLIITISVGAYFLATESDLKTIYGSAKSGSPPQTPMGSNTSNTSNYGSNTSNTSNYGSNTSNTSNYGSNTSN